MEYESRVVYIFYFISLLFLRSSLFLFLFHFLSSHFSSSIFLILFPSTSEFPSPVFLILFPSTFKLPFPLFSILSHFLSFRFFPIHIFYFLFKIENDLIEKIILIIKSQLYVNSSSSISTTVNKK